MRAPPAHIWQTKDQKRLFAFDSRCFDDRAPFLVFGPYEFVEICQRRADNGRDKIVESLLHRRCMECLGAVLGNLRRKIRRHVARPEHAPPHGGVITRNAASAMVGTSGNTAERSAVVTPSRRRLPLLIWPIDSGMLLNDRGMPAQQVVDIGAPPLWRPATISTLAMYLSGSPARCVEVPVPESVGKAARLGPCRGEKTGKRLGGEFAATSIMFGEEPSSEIGRKTLNVS